MTDKPKAEVIEDVASSEDWTTGHKCTRKGLFADARDYDREHAVSATKRKFEVIGLTTSFDEWSFANLWARKSLITNTRIYDKECDDFAKKQPMFMTMTAGLIGDSKFAIKLKTVPFISEVEYLEGPLYSITKETINGKQVVQIRYGIVI